MKTTCETSEGHSAVSSDPYTVSMNSACAYYDWEPSTTTRTVAVEFSTEGGGFGEPINVALG